MFGPRSRGALLWLALALAALPAAHAQSLTATPIDDAPPRLIVRLTPAGAAARSAPPQGFTVVRDFARLARSPRLRARSADADALGRLLVLEVEDGRSAADALRALRADPRVQAVEPDARVQTCATPNDPRLPELWGLAKLRAEQAWDTETGSAQVVVAVIDTGIDTRHPDLAPNLWVNVDEIPGNGVDDDQNGYVDDFYGYDFANDDPDPMDDNVHGTHCAGTVGAVGDNAEGVVGVCWSVKLMALKFMGASGSGYTSDAIAAIYYALENGAHVMSNSWGSTSSSPALQRAIQDARAAGVLFVAAAGNSGNATPHYPGSYPESLCVAATDRNDGLASFSTYGPQVDVAAPGVGILSTGLDGDYRSLSGTSMATPHVAGLAALLLSRNPRLTPDQLELILTSSAVDLGTPGKDERFGAGRIDAAAALALVSPDSTAFPEFALTSPAGSQVVNTPTAVRGRAAGATFASYRLELVPPGGSAWVTLRSSTTPVVDGELGRLVPDASWSDGYGALRLSVTDTAGTTFRTGSGFRFLTTELERPLSYSEFDAGQAIEVVGTAGGPGYLRYTLEYGAGNEPTSWTPIQSASRSLAGERFLAWTPPAGLRSGIYTLRLRTEFTSGTRTASVAVSLETTRVPGWPATLAPDYWGFDATPRVLALPGGNRVLTSYGTGNGVALAYDPSQLPYLALRQHGADGAASADFDPAHPTFVSQCGTPAVGDLDRDGVPEVVTLGLVNGSAKHWRVFVLEPDGRTRWSRPVSQGATPGTRPLTALADLDGDGYLDVLAGGGPTLGTLQAFDRNGEPLAGYPVQVPGATGIPLAFAVANLDDTPELELAFWVQVTGGGHRLLCYRADGTPYPGATPVELGTFSGIFTPSGPLAGDLDGDGRLDLVASGWGAGTPRRLLALRPDGTPLPGWEAVTLPWFLMDLALGDLDQDGRPEVVATTYTGDFKVYDGDGTLLTRLGTPPGGSRTGIREAAPLLADFDGDGRLDVAYPVYTKVQPPASARTPGSYWIAQVVGYRADGTPLPDFPKQLNLPVVRTTVVRTAGGVSLADLSGDGRLELIANATSAREGVRGGRVPGRIVVHRTQIPAGSPRGVWLTRQGNPHNTGVADQPPTPRPDTRPPTVAFVSPGEGATVLSFTRIELTAADDLQVAQVEVFVDGARLATLTAPPYRVNWQPREDHVGEVLLEARAVDAAGNVGQAVPRRVRVAARAIPTPKTPVLAPPQKTELPALPGG